MDVHPIKNVSIGIDPYPYRFPTLPQRSTLSHHQNLPGQTRQASDTSKSSSRRRAPVEVWLIRWDRNGVNDGWWWLMMVLWLVGATKTPLKNMKVFSWSWDGWKFPINMESHKIPWFQSPPSSCFLMIYWTLCSVRPMPLSTSLGMIPTNLIRPESRNGEPQLKPHGARLEPDRRQILRQRSLKYTAPEDQATW